LPLIAAAGASPFVLKQKDQKFKTAEKASLRSWPLPGRTGAGKFYPLLRRSLACASVKNFYALQPHGPPSFCRFSAEAFLLSGLGGL